MSAGETGTRAVVAAFFANLAIAVSKFVAFAFTGAASLLAEAIHSLADTGNQGLLLLGARRGRRPPSARHPFGYGRERYFWAFVVAVVLFSVGSLFALYEGVQKVLHPHELGSPVVGFVVLGLAVVLESFSLRTAVQEAAKLRRAGESYLGFVRRTKLPELPTVLLEDVGALVGLVLALIGLGLASATGEPRFDALGSIAIGLLLGVIAVLLATEMKSLLIGEAAEPDVASALAAALTAAPEIVDLLSLLTLQLGPDDLLVAAKVEIATDAGTAGVAAAINDAERRMRAAVPMARLIFLEPDVRTGAPAA